MITTSYILIFLFTACTNKES